MYTTMPQYSAAATMPKYHAAEAALPLVKSIWREQVTRSSIDRRGAVLNSAMDIGAHARLGGCVGGHACASHQDNI